MARTKTLPVAISLATTYELLNHRKSPDAFSLYGFYYMKARLDKTNRPYSTLKYTAAMMGWGEKRLSKAKKILKNLGLVKDIKSGEKWYVQVNYIWGENKLKNLISTTPQKEALDIKKGEVISTTPQKDVLPFSEHTLSVNYNNTSSVNYFGKKSESSSKKKTTHGEGTQNGPASDLSAKRLFSVVREDLAKDGINFSAKNFSVAVKTIPDDKKTQKEIYTWLANSPLKNGSEKRGGLLYEE